ncbi:hypothetical protein OROGR_011035 [Orobanche gracilis]
MIEEVERWSSEEELHFGGDEDELSKCERSRITYTRALLLEITEAEICRKLPGDFDLLVLSELNGAAASIVEHKWTSGNSSLLGALPTSKWDTYPGKRWDNRLLMLSKESHSQGNRSSERSHVVSEELPKDSGCDAMFLDQKTPNSGPFQLRKSANPYRPPHSNKLAYQKIPQSLDIYSELGFESSGRSSFSAVESDQTALTDSIEENDMNNKISEMFDADDKLELGITDDNQPTFEDFWDDILESLRLQQEAEHKSTPTPNSEDEICLPDEESLISVDHSIVPTFEDFWDDILESLRLQQEAEHKSTPTPNLEDEICLPDEESLISVDHSIVPMTLNFNTLENSDDAADSDDGIIWPDEDSLISVLDIISPNNSSMHIPYRDFMKTDKVTSDMAVGIRKNSEPLNAKMHSQLSNCPEKPFSRQGNGHMNFPGKSNYITYMPALNCFTCSDFLYQSCFTNTVPSNSLVQYPLLQQPNICCEQQNYLPVDTSCHNPIKQVSAKTMHQGLENQMQEVSSIKNHLASGMLDTDTPFLFRCG